ncbi:MAG: hypothetical protein PHD56_11995 [Anaerostipes sp.]|nr:hypothetical protein [Anaerostipes sp.]MDD4371774.1 hypothetical protein [Anaerostipes sp.]
MISEDKVRIMTVLARYEKNEGAADAQVYQYSRKDYVRKESLKVGVAITVAYVIAVMIFFAVNFEIFIDLVKYKRIILVVAMLVIMYLLLGFGYMQLISTKANRHYDEVMARVRSYENKLAELVAFYEEENEDNRPTIGTEENKDGTDIII